MQATDTVRARAFELMAPMIEEGNRMLADRYSAAELELITDFLTHATELQTVHTRQLRERAPYPRP